MRQGRLDDLAGTIRLLGRPVAEAGPTIASQLRLRIVRGHYTRRNLLNMYFNMYYP